MRLADLRFLFDYDRWATRRVLDAVVGHSPGDLDMIYFAEERAGISEPGA